MIQRMTCVRCGQSNVPQSHLCSPPLKFKEGDLVAGSGGRLEVVGISVVEGQVCYDVRTPGTRGTPWAYPVRKLESIVKRVGGPRRK